MLTFEGEQHQGMEAIMQKLTTLNFQTVQHIPKTVDVHPGINGAIVVFVTGNLAVRARRALSSHTAAAQARARGQQAAAAHGSHAQAGCVRAPLPHRLLCAAAALSRARRLRCVRRWTAT
jgi:hypothetical protein